MAAPHPHPVGVGEGQHSTGTAAVDPVEVEVGARPAGQVVRPVAHLAERPSVGAFVAAVAAHQAHAQGEVGRQLVEPPAQHVAFVHQCREHAGEAPIRRASIDDHAGEPRMHGQRQHRAAGGGG